MSDPKFVKYVADSTGVELYVQPVSPFTFRAIRQKALALYPDPDPKPFERPMPNAALEGDMIPGTEHPEWGKLSEAQNRLRSNFVTQSLMIVACAQTPNKQALIERFQDEIEAIRQIVPIPENAWEATLLHGILKGQREPGEITDLASENLPLTPDEVVEGVARFFRYTVPRKALSGSSG